MGTASPRWRVLVVDDHADTVSALARLLRQCGHELVEAGSVREAMDAATAAPFDLLISDLGLPDGTGCTLLRAIVSTNPIRAIALTGFTDDGTADEARAAGFSRLLSKPVSFSELLLAMQDVMTRPTATSTSAASAVSAAMPEAQAGTASDLRPWQYGM